MNTQRNTPLYWPYYYQGKSIEELKQSLVCTTLELETTKLAAQAEIRKQEEKLTHLQELLNKAITERDEAQENYKTLLLEKLQLEKQVQKSTPQVLSRSSSSSIEDEPKMGKNNGGNFCTSDSDDSIFSSSPPSPSSTAVPKMALQLISGKKSMPEKGSLLQAVINAGPLLQNLLLAGPLPQWRHPPPPLERFEIPPVKIGIDQGESGVNVNREEFRFNGYDVCGDVNRRRGCYYACEDSQENNKYQRVH